jgi:hypothetical protein
MPKICLGTRTVTGALPAGSTLCNIAPERERAKAAWIAKHFRLWQWPAMHHWWRMGARATPSLAAHAHLKNAHGSLCSR